MRSVLLVIALTLPALAQPIAAVMLPATVVEV